MKPTVTTKKKTGIKGIAQAIFEFLFMIIFCYNINVCNAHHILSVFEQNETIRNEMKRRICSKASYQWFVFILSLPFLTFFDLHLVILCIPRWFFMYFEFFHSLSLSISYLLINISIYSGNLSKCLLIANLMQSP